MRVVDRYIALNFIRGTIPIVILLLTLFGFLVFTEELEDVGKGAYRAADALQVTLYTTPQRLADLMPVATLLGALIGLGWMANASELVALRSLGMTPRGMARALLMVAAGLVVVLLLLQQYAAPTMERSAARLRAKSLPATEIASGGDAFWSRDDGRYIHIGTMRHGRVPADIEIYELAPNARLRSLVEAEWAHIVDDGRWHLHGVRETRIEPERVDSRTLDSRLWDSFLTEKQMSVLMAEPQTLSLSNLHRFVRLLRGNALDSHRYELILWQRLSAPVGLIAMSVLGLPFLLGSLRRASGSQRIMLGAGVGIAFYLSEQIAGQLALMFRLDPLISAFGPDLALLGVAILVMVRIDK